MYNTDKNYFGTEAEITRKIVKTNKGQGNWNRWSKIDM